MAIFYKIKVGLNLKNHKLEALSCKQPLGSKETEKEITKV